MHGARRDAPRRSSTSRSEASTAARGPADRCRSARSSARGRAGSDRHRDAARRPAEHRDARHRQRACAKSGRVTLVQTDAAINPGQQRRPLLDRDGQVIGITTMGIQRQRARLVVRGRDRSCADAARRQRRRRRRRQHRCAALQRCRRRRAASAAERSARDRGTRTLRADASRTLARRADALDDVLAHVHSALLRGRDRRRLRSRVVRVVRCRSAMQGAVAPGCSRAFSDLHARRRSTIRDGDRRARRSARQADVYPGHAARRPAALPARLRTRTGYALSRLTHRVSCSVRIGIDARKLHDFGIGTYIRNLLRQLARLDQRDRVRAALPARGSRGAGALGENFRPVAETAGNYSIAEQLQDPAGAEARGRDAVSRAALRAAAARAAAGRS